MFRLLFCIVAGMLAVSPTVWAQSNDMQRIVLDFRNDWRLGGGVLYKPASDTNNVGNLRHRSQRQCDP